MERLRDELEAARARAEAAGAPGGGLDRSDVEGMKTELERRSAALGAAQSARAAADQELKQAQVRARVWGKRAGNTLHTAHNTGDSVADCTHSDTVHGSLLLHSVQLCLSAGLLSASSSAWRRMQKARIRRLRCRLPAVGCVAVQSTIAALNAETSNLREQLSDATSAVESATAAVEAATAAAAAAQRKSGRGDGGAAAAATQALAKASAASASMSQAQQQQIKALKEKDAVSQVRAVLCVLSCAVPCYASLRHWTTYGGQLILPQCHLPGDALDLACGSG